MNYFTTHDKVSMNDIPQRKIIAQKELQTNCGEEGRVEKETMSFTLLKF